MSSNYEWQNFETRERIEDRLRDAKSHRLIKSGVEKRRFPQSINQMLTILEMSIAKIFDYLIYGIKFLQRNIVKISHFLAHIYLGPANSPKKN
jgi:hypothetical protein